MTNPTYQAFVEAILAEPNDETHRLVCSDWLEDQGRSSEAEKFRVLPGTAAVWCSDWGQDQFGLWSEFRVKEAVQRLRWIEPGSFWMGSPEDEEGRKDDEDPRHEVGMQRGFWMFDTPCTQELWQAVMGNNPSEFQSENRPVETVSWEDCQEFLAKASETVVGLKLRLPTEAEWEYACRAGTQGPRYHQDLDQIAWYDENSERKPHPVQQKEPNRWGLHDMLGNVWEWCDDLWRDNYRAEPESSLRVFRGGSWLDDAQSVRAAYRNGDEPDYRDVFISFRCVEFRDPDVGGNLE